MKIHTARYVNTLGHIWYLYLEERIISMISEHHYDYQSNLKHLIDATNSVMYWCKAGR